MAAYIVLVCEIVVLFFTMICVKYGASLWGTLMVVSLMNASICIYAFTMLRKKEHRTDRLEDKLRKLYQFNQAFLSKELLVPAIEQELLSTAKLLVALRAKLVRLSTGGLQAIFTSTALARISNPLQEYESEKRTLLDAINRIESRFESLLSIAHEASARYSFEVKSREELLSTARAELDDEAQQLRTRTSEALFDAGFSS